MFLRIKPGTCGVTAADMRPSARSVVHHINAVVRRPPGSQRMKDAKPLPQGTRVEITAHWDNSANNPYNPDPAATVKWGNPEC